MLATCYLSAICLLFENVFYAMFLKSPKMSDDDYSCIKEVTKNVPITLSTACQRNEITGISQILDSWKCQYIQQLQGIVVSYRNVTLMSKNAYIKSDYPVILCNVKATFELFIPTVGSIVKGKINRISHDYIGCLVHNCINVAIHRSRNEYDNISHFISVDKVILLEITHIGFKRKIIRVKGKITQECMNLMKNMYSSIEETNSVHQNMLTSSQEFSSNTDSEGHNNNHRDEGMAEDFCSDVNLFDERLNDTRSSSSKKKKKKKSDKIKTEQTLSSHFETFGTENGELSPRLQDSSSYNKSHDSSDEMTEKSNVHSNFKPYESPLKSSKITSPNSLLSESVSLLTENSTDKDSNHTKKKKKKKDKLKSEQRSDELLVSSSDFTTSNCHSPKKKKSEKDNSKSSHNELLGNPSFDFTSSPNSIKKKKSKKDSDNSSQNEQLGNPSFDFTPTSNSHKKKKSKEDSSNSSQNEQLGNPSFDFTPISNSLKKKKSKKDSSNSSHDELLGNPSFDFTPSSKPLKKKKSKKDNDSSLDKVFIKEEYSTDTCTDTSSSSKKKKHKKSKSNILSSPPLFSDSQSSCKEEIETFKIPKSPPKKKQKVSQDKISANEKRTNLKDFSSSLNENDILNLSISLKETDIKKEENVDELIEALSCYDPSLGNEMRNEVLVKDKHLDSSKKAKKRKHESPEIDGLPKKKKKIEETEGSLAKSSNKHKTKKKSKEKSDKDSKKDKKKSKKRVISSKKKLPKLTKKKKENGEKLKKKLKKSKLKIKEEPC